MFSDKPRLYQHLTYLTRVPGQRVDLHWGFAMKPRFASRCSRQLTLKYVEICWTLDAICHTKIIENPYSECHLATWPSCLTEMNIRKEPSGAKCPEDGTNPQKNVGQVMLGSLFAGWKRLFPVPSTERSERMLNESGCWHCLPSKSKNSGHAAASDWQRVWCQTKIVFVEMCKVCMSSWSRMLSDVVRCCSWFRAVLESNHGCIVQQSIRGRHYLLTSTIVDIMRYQLS